jgi:hypothetical protein
MLDKNLVSKLLHYAREKNQAIKMFDTLLGPAGYLSQISKGKKWETIILCTSRSHSCIMFMRRRLCKGWRFWLKEKATCKVWVMQHCDRAKSSANVVPEHCGVNCPIDGFSYKLDEGTGEERVDNLINSMLKELDKAITLIESKEFKNEKNQEFLDEVN